MALKLSGIWSRWSLRRPCRVRVQGHEISAVDGLQVASLPFTYQILRVNRFRSWRLRVSDVRGYSVMRYMVLVNPKR